MNTPLWKKPPSKSQRARSWLRALSILLWKSFVLRRRMPAAFVAELSIPLVIAVILVGVASIDMRDYHADCHVQSVRLPSLGMLAHVQSLVCNFNNTCHPTDYDPDPPFTGIPQLLNMVNEMLAGSGRLDEEAITYKNFKHIALTIRRAANLSKAHKGNDHDAAIQQLSNLICGCADECNDLSRLIDLKRELDQLKQAKTLADLRRLPREAKKPTLAKEACDAVDFLLNTRGFQKYTGRLRASLFGSIAYYPASSVTRQIMRNALESYRAYEQFRSKVNEWFIKDGPRARFKQYLRKQSIKPDTESFDRTLCATSNSLLCRLVHGVKNISSFDSPVPGNIGLSAAVLFDQIDVMFTFLREFMDCFRFQREVKEFASLEGFEAHLQHSQQDGLENTLGVQFDHLPDWNETHRKLTSPQISVTYRAPAHKVDATFGAKVMDDVWDPVAPSRFDLRYLSSGILDLQDMVGRGVIATLGLRTLRQNQRFPLKVNDLEEEFIGAEMKLMPTPCWSEDRFLRSIDKILPLLLVLTWTMTVVITVKSIVLEKETRIKEFTKVMGLTNGIHWVNWTILSLFIMLFSSFVMALFLTFGNVFRFTAISFLFSFFASYAVALFAFCCFLSVFFERANIAAVMSGLVYFLAYFPVMIINQLEGEINNVILNVFCLFPQVPFSFGCLEIARLEIQGVGATWTTAWNGSSKTEFSLIEVCSILWMNGLLFTVLTLYLEAVLPDTSGARKPWNFIFTRKFWRGAKRNMIFEEPSCDPPSGPDIEPDPTALKCGVMLNGLTKCFSESDNPAVDRLTVKFFKGQVTSFLGHNGAGKTTTIAMLAGLCKPTSGMATVNTYSISDEVERVRSCLGFCPQHNILIPQLTAAEHIQFFAMLKGLSYQKAVKASAFFADLLGFKEKCNRKTSTLSGGQMRKLCVALAFLGEPSVIVLDEPTAGVDPYSRRSIWELITRFKEDRTIILSTHYMDEADILGDRIVIISQGKLQAVGSSMFLKSRFSQGYRLTAEKSSDPLVENRDRQLNQRDEFTCLLKRFLPGTKLVRESPTELQYILPVSGAVNGSFEDLFTELESYDLYLRFGIVSYGITDTSLEEVFVQVAKDPCQQPKITRELPSYRLQRCMQSFRSRIANCMGSKAPLDEDDPSTATQGSLASLLKYQKASNCATWFMQYRALLRKRMLRAWRYKRGWITEILLPVIVIFFVACISLLSPSLKTQPPLQLNHWQMARHLDDAILHSFVVKNGKADHVSRLYGDLLDDAISLVGTRCTQTRLGVPFEPRTLDYCRKTENEVWTDNAFIPDPLPSCKCQITGFQQCPALLQHLSLSNRTLDSTDRILDLTGQNVAEYLIKTTSIYRGRRFGGLQLMRAKDARTYAQFLDNLSTKNRFYRLLGDITSFGEHIDTYWQDLGARFHQLLPPVHWMRIHFDNHGFTSAPAYLNIFQTLQLRHFVSDETLHSNGKVTRRDLGIVPWLHPLPSVRKEMEKSIVFTMIFHLTVSIFLMLALSFIPASFVVFLIWEKQSGAKQLQLVSGLNRCVYWLANYSWDIFNYLIPASLCLLIFVSFGLDFYVSSDHIGAFTLLVVLYGLGVTPMLYPASFWIKTPSTAFVILCTLNLMVGAIATLTVFLLEQFEHLDWRLAAVNSTLKIVFLFFPQYCFGRGVMLLVERSLAKSLGLQPILLFSMGNLGRIVLALSLHSIGHIAVILVIEKLSSFPSLLDYFPEWWQKLARPWVLDVVPPDTLDPDVLAEKKRVEKVQALTKIYRGQTQAAVNGLSFALRRAECFGLLGVNGAGKSTTFRMLTSSTSITRGKAVVCGHSIAIEADSVFRSIGYCPQQDALMAELTCTETLTLFGHLRGIPLERQQEIVRSLLDHMMLRPYADRTVAQLSGGNRRKLSVAVACIGDPAVLLLDEPTSGMDARARRFIWEQIKSLLKGSRSILLTSHSMEECEALCDRVGIMVDGQFRCLGSVQHLKNRFGYGYTVNVSTSQRSQERGCAKTFHHVRKRFTGKCRLNESHMRYQQYQFPPTVPLSTIFRGLNSLRSEGVITAFSVFQTNLDQIFIHFAKQNLHRNA